MRLYEALRKERNDITASDNQNYQTDERQFRIVLIMQQLRKYLDEAEVTNEHNL